LPELVPAGLRWSRSLSPPRLLALRHGRGVESRSDPEQILGRCDFRRVGLYPPPRHCSPASVACRGMRTTGRSSLQPRLHQPYSGYHLSDAK
jgi:hypothetical protein